MSCMKCARETEAGQVFCSECLEDMKKYPVKPGTVVQLPRRREASPFKKVVSRRRILAPSEQIEKLRRQLRIQAIVILGCLVLIAALLYPVLKPIFQDTGFKPGQNYSSLTDTKPQENSVGISDE